MILYISTGVTKNFQRPFGGQRGISKPKIDHKWKMDITPPCTLHTAYRRWRVLPSYFRNQRISMLPDLFDLKSISAHRFGLLDLDFLQVSLRFPAHFREPTEIYGQNNY